MYIYCVRLWEHKVQIPIKLQKFCENYFKKHMYNTMHTVYIFVCTRIWIHISNKICIINKYITKRGFNNLRILSEKISKCTFKSLITKVWCTFSKMPIFLLRLFKKRRVLKVQIYIYTNTHVLLNSICKKIFVHKKGL